RMAARQDELLDVVAVGGYVVVAEQRKLLTTPGQLGPQLRSMISRWPFGPVGAVGVDDLIEDPAHVHNAGDLRPPGVVILLLNRVRRQPRGKLFGVVVGTA